MPPRKKPASPKKRARAVRIAKAAAAGKPAAAIAREIGLSRSQVCRLLKSEEVAQILVVLVNDEFQAISSLFKSALRVIAEAMEAERVVVCDGAPLPGGPDHFARLTAVARLAKLLTAGRPVPRSTEEAGDKGTMTLQQLEASLNEHDPGAPRHRTTQ